MTVQDETEGSFFIFKPLYTSYLAEHIITLHPVSISGWFQVRSASFFMEKKMQAWEALYPGLEREKLRIFVISAQIENTAILLETYSVIFC